jgi:hypothetical protein
MGFEVIGGSCAKLVIGSCFAVTRPDVTMFLNFIFSHLNKLPLHQFGEKHA